MKMKTWFFGYKGFGFLVVITLSLISFTPPSYKMAKLKYNGGGDWYANRTALPNLIIFCNQNIKTNFDTDEAIVEAGSSDIYNYPFVYLTGHGNVVFSDQEAQNLRDYLMAGGFLHIDDNYGLDKFIRPQMKKVFPELDFVELPPSHAIYNQTFKFPKGLPKIHEHDGKRQQGLALIYKGKITGRGNLCRQFGAGVSHGHEGRAAAARLAAPPAPIRRGVFHAAPLAGLGRGRRAEIFNARRRGAGPV